MDDSLTGQVPQPPRLSRRSRWRRRAAIVAALLLTVWCFRASLLQGLAAGLIVDDRPGPSQRTALQPGASQHAASQHGGALDSGSQRAVVILDGDRHFDAAAEMHRTALHDTGASTIIVFLGPPGRLVRMGIIQPADETARRELLKRGISDRDLEVLPVRSGNRSTVAAELGRWLAEHPSQTVSVLCDRFTSRTWKIVIQQSVDAALIRRISIVPLEDRQFDETNWWRSKPGQMALLSGYIRLGYHCWRPENGPERGELTDDDFHAAFAGGPGQ